MIKEHKIICGQTSTGRWYCKELPVDSTAELKLLIGEVNEVLNLYNAEEKKKKNKKISRVRM